MSGEQTDLMSKDELALTGARIHPRIQWVDERSPQIPHVVDVANHMPIGSSPDVPIRVADRAVSRLHAELEVRRDGVWLRDLGSKNGSFVEGVFVQQARVPHGGRITLGKTTLTLSILAEPEKVHLWPHDRFGPLVGRSEPMRELFARLAQYAESEATVLIQGETGTGKELVAQAIHEASDRSSEPFVIVDCGALPETLLESELFGHAKGAFTGALNPRAGAIEVAHGGTLFLDEIGELPLSMQPKLLRAIEAKAVRRLGETSYRSVDVRFIAATHRDLQGMVASGAFREDLFFRLSVLPTYVPPLRDRAGDIPLLLHEFLGGRAPALAANVVTELLAHPFLGNVRELKNLAERMVVLKPEPAWALTRAEAAGPRAPRSSPRIDDLPRVNTGVPFKELRERWLDHLEREYIGELIRVHARNVTAISEAAGLDRTYVHRLLRKHDL